MANKDIRDAIDANIKAILIAQGFNFEDNSTDAQQKTTPLAALRPVGIGSDSVYGQRPGKGWLERVVRIVFNDKSQENARVKSNDFYGRVVENITPPTLNVGALLATDKNVNDVKWEDAGVSDLEAPQYTMEIPIRVEYQEV